MTEQPNINSHSENKFSEIVEHALKCGGVHVIASKNHGKSRLLFSMAKALREKPNVRTLIFDGSETWLYAFSRIPTFTVTEKDIVLVSENHTTEDIERYELSNWHLVECALRNYDSLLFRLKTRKPSKRGYFVRTVINYLDRLQREQRALTSDNEPRQYIAYFIEEAQDCFNSRSTTRLEAEEFLTVFNEARNQKEAFYTASQRLSDFSKTIRTKQLYCIGKVALEDVSVFLRKLERQYGIDFSKLEPRTWFLEGKTFVSPEWRQREKPYQINKSVRNAYLLSIAQPQRKRGLDKIREWLRSFREQPKAEQPKTEQTERAEQSTSTEEKEYFCPNCNQPCTKEEFESGYCLDCDVLESLGE